MAGEEHSQPPVEKDRLEWPSELTRAERARHMILGSVAIIGGTGLALVPETGGLPIVAGAAIGLTGTVAVVRAWRDGRAARRDDHSGSNELL